MSPFDAPVAYVLLAASLAVLLGAAVIANMRHPNRDAEIDAAMRRHPAGKAKTPAPTRPAAHEPRVGAGSKGQCSSTGCGYPASMWVIAADQFGGGVRHLCVGCHNEGLKFGWWRISLGANPTAFDFEIADDLDRLEHLANGDGAA